MMEDKDNVKKVKNWGTGGGMYRGVKASVKTLNVIIVVLLISLVVVVLYLAKSSSYTATFEMNGGESIAMGNYKYGEVIELDKEPTKTGYNFAGWYQDKDLRKPWNLETDIMKESTTLYAKWDPSSIHVLFDLNGGSLDGETMLPAQDLLFHEPYGDLPSPSKDGHIFVGWQYDNNWIASDSIVNMNGEHTLKAVYE